MIIRCLHELSALSLSFLMIFACIFTGQEPLVKVAKLKAGPLQEIEKDN